VTAFNLESLAAIIAERARDGGERSYTRKLLEEGPEKCAKKLGEEAVEAALAAASGDRSAVVAESADLLYHLLVVLQSRGVALREVYEELERRTARSGIDEKESRRRD
jgi:phosphoribosyl-ATP pyrophosphohydrolase